MGVVASYLELGPLGLPGAAESLLEARGQLLVGVSGLLPGQRDV